MITEVMALLIAVGAIMIFIVWNQSKRRQQKAEERREVEQTTGKLKQELEKTANEVINRMESHVSNLEDLLDESENNRTVLEGRVAELKKLLKRSEGQSTEIRDLLTKLEEAGDTVEELQRRLELTEKKIAMSMQMQVPMQMPMQSTMMPMSTPMMTPMTQTMMAPPLMTTPLPNVPSPISPPPILSSRQTPAPPIATTSTLISTATPKSKTYASSTTKASSTTTKSTTPSTPPAKRDKAEIKKALEKASTEQEDKAEPKDFAKVLEKSMANDKAETTVKTPRVPDRRSIIVSSNANQHATVVERDQPVKIDSKRISSTPARPARAISTPEPKNEERTPLNNSERIKNMLLEGMSVEEIARETGLGRGAVELVQEMTRRKLERK